MGLTDKIHAILNQNVIRQFNDLVKEHFVELDWWVNCKYTSRELVPNDQRHYFVQYDLDYSEFKRLGTTNKEFEKFNYKQKNFLVDRKENIVSLYKIYLHCKSVEEKFNRICNQYPLVIRYYVEKEMGIRFSINSPEAIIKKGKYNANVKYTDIRPVRKIQMKITSVSDLPFDIKEKIYSLDEKLLYELQNEINCKVDKSLKQKEKTNIKYRFREYVLENIRRHKYYKLFLQEKKIDIEGEEYCINHLKELDKFIKTTLKSKYDELKNTYPEGIKYYDANNEFSEGDHLKGVDYWEDCIRCSSMIKKQHAIAIKYNKLYAKYPNGIDEYKDAHQIIDDNLCCVFVPSKEEIVNLGEDRLRECEELSITIRRNRKWIKEQWNFAQKCRNLHDKIFKGWGCYYYDLVISTPSLRKSPNKDNYRVWEHFFNSYCTDTTLDYSYTPNQKTEYEKTIPLLLNMKCHYKTRIYDKVVEYICSLKKEYGNILVLFGDSGMKSKVFNNFHFNYLIKRLEENSIFYGSDLINIQYPFLYKFIIVVEVVSTNNHLKEQCLDIINNFNSQSPHIAFISLEKEYDKQEMLSFINTVKSKKEEEQKEIEKKECEERRKKQEETEKRKQIEKEKAALLKCVSGWNEPLRASVRCFSMYYYYPTTCDWEADDREWWVRNLIWDFKASPNKPQTEKEIMERHCRAVKIIVRNVEKCLRHFFNNEISKLTFVCIPSSKAIVTQRRYADFSEQICNVLGMSNAYKHIYVEQDGEAKHIGGTIQAKYTFDENFFRDKYVLLFDDVITSGKSMEKFKNRMECMGAYVIGGFSIGKTKHERQDSNPIDTLGNNDRLFYNELPF